VKNILCALVLFTWLASVGRAATQNVVLNWTAIPSSAVMGYNVYFGTNSGQYVYKIKVGKQTTVTISNLNPGLTYFFAATSLGTNGTESHYSSEVNFIVPGILTINRGANPGLPALIQFPVVPGHWYELQATTNFQTWSSIWQTSVAVSNSWTQFTDQDAATFRSRFYRLVLH
jgi:hypothetical protein